MRIERREMKAMNWGHGHVDTYSYMPDAKLWLKVRCRIPRGMDCTAPKTLERGTKFSYNAKETAGLMDDAEAAMAEYEEQHQQLIECEICGKYFQRSGLTIEPFYCTQCMHSALRLG